MNFYFYIIGTTILYVLGDIAAKVWSMKSSGVFLIASLSAYFVGSLFFISAIKKSSMSLAIIISSILITVVGILFGYFYFGERLSHSQYLGIGLGVIALTFLLFPFQIFSK